MPLHSRNTIIIVWKVERCTAISPLYKLIWPLHVRIRGNWAESVSTLLKNGAIVRSLGDTVTTMAPSLCWDFKLSNEGSFVEIGQEMTKPGWKVWKKILQSLRAELQSLRAESIAVCMQRWSFRRPSLSWETSFVWSEKKVRALPGVSPHPVVKTWPGFQVKWTQPDFSWFFMRTIPAAENRGGGPSSTYDWLGWLWTIWSWMHLVSSPSPTQAGVSGEVGWVLWSYVGAGDLSQEWSGSRSRAFEVLQGKKPTIWVRMRLEINWWVAF